MQQDPSFYTDCAAILGPNQPGITTPDPTATAAAAKTSTKGGRSARSARSRKASTRTPTSRKRASRDSQPADRTSRKSAGETLRERIEQTLGLKLPPLPANAAPALPSAGQAAPQTPNAAKGAADPQQLLDFLLGP
jgi:hypothetical protein